MSTSKYINDGFPPPLLEELERLGEPDIKYLLRYNLDGDNRPADGRLAVLGDRLILCDGDELRSLAFERASDFEATGNFGSVSLECKLDGELFELCRGDMRLREEFFDAALQLEKFRLDPSFAFSATDAKTCPKCRRRLDGGSCPFCADKRAVFARLVGMAAPYKRPLAAAVLMFFAASALQMVVPYLQRVLIDGYIYVSPERAALIVPLDLLVIVAGMFALDVAVNALGIGRGLILAGVSNKLIFGLRSLVYSKIQELSLSRLSKRTSGELINRVTNDTAILQDFLTYELPDIAGQLITLVIMGAYMFFINWKLALMIIIPAPLYVFASYSVWRFLHKLYDRNWQMNSRANSILHDIFSGIRIVKSFGTEKKEIARYGKAVSDQTEIAERAEVLWNLMTPVSSLFLTLGSYFVLYYVGSRIIGGSMTRGEMGQFSMYAGILYGPLRWAAFLPRAVVRAMTSAAKIFALADEETDVKPPSSPVEKRIEGYIELRNVHFGYKSFEPVLKGVSLSVKPGEMIGIVGRSGAGKSTLINLLMRIYDVTEGRVLFDGVDVRDYDPACLRSQIGVVLQETFLFAGTIYENIAYAKPGASYDEVIRAVKLANAHQFIMKLPDAYNTKVGEKGHTLSGGERQRIAIARAVLHDPAVLILDEATAALDIETEALVQDALQKLTAERTVFAIAHRLSTLRGASRLIVMDGGVIAEVGAHEELLKKGGLYHNLVMAQRQMTRRDASSRQLTVDSV